MSGLMHIYTGEGKGKTTTAVGLIIRAIGNGFRVLFVQFIKESFSGEISILQKFPELIDIYRCDTGFIYEKTKQNQKEKIKNCLEELRIKIKNSKYDMIVFDELAVAISLGLISKDDTEEFLSIINKNTEIIITGRGAPQWLIDRADLVTEMKNIKHYYDKGILARRGIEY